MKTAVFFERDGILNTVPAVDGEQVAPCRFEHFKINEQAILPLRRLKAAGYLLIATTNQPAISEGELSRWDLDRMNETLKRTFGLDDILVCPHHADDECPCRKPAAGLFQEAAFKWHIELEQSFVVSDKWQDANAARLFGATSLLVDSPWVGDGHHDFVLPNVAAIAKKILQLQPVQHAMVA